MRILDGTTREVIEYVRSGAAEMAIAEARNGDPQVRGQLLYEETVLAVLPAGHPLADEDRWPWLDRIGARLAEGPRVIVACSALKRAYRDRLRAAAGPSLRFLFLKGDKDMMRARVAARKNHYMPASLIDSQFATLEPPQGEGDVVTLDAGKDVARLTEEAVKRLGS